MACRRTAAWNIIGLVFKYGCRLLLESHRWSWCTHLDWFCVSAAVESHCCSLCMLGETVCSLMNIYCWLCENMELHQVIHQHENSDIYCFMIFFAFWLLIGATLWHKRSTKTFSNCNPVAFSTDSQGWFDLMHIYSWYQPAKNNPTLSDLLCSRLDHGSGW